MVLFSDFKLFYKFIRCFSFKCVLKFLPLISDNESMCHYLANSSSCSNIIMIIHCIYTAKR